MLGLTAAVGSTANTSNDVVIFARTGNLSMPNKMSMLTTALRAQKLSDGGNMLCEVVTLTVVLRRKKQNNARSTSERTPYVTFYGDCHSDVC